MQARKWSQLLGVALLLLLVWKVSLLVMDRHYDSLDGHSSVGSDRDASVVRLSSRNPAQDTRGWLLDPLKAASQAGLSGGAVECTAVHAGEIRPATVRANHRHHFCNETFLWWNAKALFRLENAFMDGGFAQSLVEAGEISIATAAAGRAHALANIDRHNSLFFVACQDARLPGPQDPKMTEPHIWSDL